MTNKGYLTAAGLAIVAILITAGVAQGASSACIERECSRTLQAGPTVKRWAVPGNVGESFVLYMNIYSGGKRLSYRLLQGGCDASYSSPDVSAVLHACGHHSTLDYVAFNGRHKLHVKYRFIRR